MRLKDCTTAVELWIVGEKLYKVGDKEENEISNI
jgi:hypothetical protein